MTIKKIKLFGWREGWPWWLVLAIDTVATVQAVNYNYLTTKEGISFGGWVALISVMVAFYSITTWRYILRRRFINSIIGYTSQGAALILSQPVINRELGESGVPKILNFVDSKLKESFEFWKAWAYGPKGVARPLGEDVFNGTIITLVDKPFEYKGIKYMGLQSLDQVIAVWPSKDKDLLGRILLHEAGHMCLFDLGIEGYQNLGENHHKIFAEAGCNF